MLLRYFLILCAALSVSNLSALAAAEVGDQPPLIHVPKNLIADRLTPVELASKDGSFHKDGVMFNGRDFHMNVFIDPTKKLPDTHVTIGQVLDLLPDMLTFRLEGGKYYLIKPGSQIALPAHIHTPYLTVALVNEGMYPAILLQAVELHKSTYEEDLKYTSTFEIKLW